MIVQNRNIACVGNLTQDHLFQVDALPQLDDVAYVNKAVECIGGRGVIVALTLGHLTRRQTSLVTVLPATERAVSSIQFLERNFVSTEGVDLDANASHEHEVTVALSREDRNCISFFRPSDVTFTASDKQRNIVSNSVLAYFSTHKRSFNLSLLDGVDTKRTTVVHNVANYLSADEEYRQAMLSKSHVLICNDQEATSLRDREGLDGVTALFNKSNVLRTIYVTHGENGSTVYGWDGSQEQFGVHECEVQAPVGAGDAYASGVVYGIAEGWTVAKGVELGKRLAALSVSSATSYPDLSRVQDVLQEVARNV